MCLFEWVFSFFLSIYPGVELLDYTVVLVSVFWGKFRTVFIVAAPIYISTNSVQRFLFSTSLPMFVICRLFDSSLSDRSGIILQVMLYLIKLSFSCSVFIASLEHEKHIKHVCYCSFNVTLLIYLKVNLVSHWHAAHGGSPLHVHGHQWRWLVALCAPADPSVFSEKIAIQVFWPFLGFFVDRVFFFF